MHCRRGHAPLLSPSTHYHCKTDPVNPMRKFSRTVILPHPSPAAAARNNHRSNHHHIFLFTRFPFSSSSNPRDPNVCLKLGPVEDIISKVAATAIGNV
jgi:hypothetical protein